MHKASAVSRNHWVASRTRSFIHILFSIIAASTLTACWSGHSSSGSSTYAVGGGISGLSSAGLVLQNESDTLIVAANTSSFQFQVAPGANYNVTVATQPAGLTCTVSHGSGTNVRATVSTISVVCSPVTHAISGTITGLTTNGLVLRNNGSDDLTIAANATTFQFTTPVAAGGGYSVTAFAQPAGLTCTVSNGVGSNVNTDITNIHIACSEITFKVGGTITGLTGSGLVLQNSGGDDLSVAGNATTFEFATQVAYGGGYAVTVLTQPTGQYCSITNATGTNTTAQVTNVTLTCGQATLTPSIATVALAVTGNPRQITITNNGSFVAANLSIAYPTWPSGTSAVSTCATILTPSASCTITITPGSSATAGAGNAACSTGIVPTPGTITVSADNAPSSTIDAVILSNGCIYQAGYVYAIDDTTPTTGSIGGKVVSLTDQAPAYPNGVIWGSNGGSGGGSGGIDSADASTDIVPGIDETSTSSSSSPNYATFVSFFSSNYTNPNPFTSSSFSACNGNSDGHCNTSNILAFYDQFVTNNTTANGGTAPFTASAGPTPRSHYAAGSCGQTIGGYTDWYLPAICEMGGTGQGAGCTNAANTTIDNLVQLGVTNLAGYYWSSTESSAIPQSGAWAEDFETSGVGSVQTGYYKYAQAGVRCSRVLTP